jgi:uncharacterized damage-inducible protein DinB
MLATDVLAATLKTSNMVLTSYVSDLSDEELLIHPAAGCNHLAWQLGHLISSHVGLLESVCPGKAIQLPEGFEAAHTKEMASCDDPSKFFTKDQYVDLIQKHEAATIAAWSEMNPEQLDAPAPEHFRQMFPTVGHICVLIATHGMMHAGQFVPVRRSLGKPVVI